MTDAGFPILDAKVSIFESSITSAAGRFPTRQGTLDDVFRLMHSESLRKLTHELRAITDEKQQKAFKAEYLPYVTFGGTFSQRNLQGLLLLSGLQCFDFDHLGGEAEVGRVRQLLKDDPLLSTELLFTSPRGNGVKWVTHVDFNEMTYDEWYRTIRAYLYRTYGLEADSAPSSVVSACFLCFDANVITNPKICVF